MIRACDASIQETTGLMNLPLIIADRRHDLFGHVCRLPPETPVPRALQLCTDVYNGDRPTSEWKRPLGRPRQSWLQQIDEDFGPPVNVAYTAAQDRSNWRSLRPSAGLAHQWVSEWVSEWVTLLRRQKFNYCWKGFQISASHNNNNNNLLFIITLSICEQFTKVRACQQFTKVRACHIYALLHTHLIINITLLYQVHPDNQVNVTRYSG